MAKLNGLGRGLDSLFEDNDLGERLTNLSLDVIEPDPNQPRKAFDDESLKELADSISLHGLLQPLLVRALPSGKYRIIAGERRYRASRLAGLTEVPAIVKDYSDSEAASAALIENLQREDLNPIDEARGYARLINEFKLTQEEAAKEVGKSRVAITNSMRLLKLPESIADMLGDGRLSAGHARALLGLNDEEKMLEAARRVVNLSLSVRQTEKLVKSMNDSAANGEKPRESLEDKDVAESYMEELENRISGRLSRKVEISQKGKGGTVTLKYKSNDDLEELIRLLCGEDFI